VPVDIVDHIVVVEHIVGFDCIADIVVQRWRLQVQY
jgi:hypothetical protein